MSFCVNVGALKPKDSSKALALVDSFKGRVSNLPILLKLRLQLNSEVDDSSDELLLYSTSDSVYESLVQRFYLLTTQPIRGGLWRPKADALGLPYFGDEGPQTIHVKWVLSVAAELTPGST